MSPDDAPDKARALAGRLNTHALLAGQVNEDFEKATEKIF